MSYYDHFDQKPEHVRAFTAAMLIALSLVLLSALGCAHPVPQPLSLPVLHEVLIDIVPELEGNAYQGAIVDVDGIQKVCCPGGVTTWSKPVDQPTTHVHIEAPGYLTIDEDLNFHTGTNPYRYPLRRAFLPRLVPAGQFFRTETGERVSLAEASDFNLYARFLAGEDIRPILADREGANLLRVWLAYRVPLIGELMPFEHPDFYTRLPDFVSLAGSYGKWVEFTAFAGPREMGVGVDSATWNQRMRDHWRQTCDALRPLPVLLELANENSQGANAGLVGALAKCDGVVTSVGADPYNNYSIVDWDYIVLHTNGQIEEQRKVGHNCMEISSTKPCLTNETSRYPEVGMWNGQTLSYQKQLAIDTAAGSALLNAGWCFHSVHGKDSTLWTPEEKAVFQAGLDGSRSVPLSCQDGGYERLDPGTFMRVYRRGGRAECTVRIRF